MISLKKRLMALGLSSTLAVGGVFIAHKEGMRNDVYLDSARIPTACYGKVDPSFKLGMTFSTDQCDKWLAEDIIKFDTTLSAMLSNPYQSTEQHVGLLSFCYNVGLGACRSSTLRREFNKGNYLAACEQIPRWRFITRKGVKLDCSIRGNDCYGLYVRRDLEMKLCKGEITIEEALGAGLGTL